MAETKNSQKSSMTKKRSFFSQKTKKVSFKIHGVFNTINNQDVENSSFETEKPLILLDLTTKND